MLIKKLLLVILSGVLIVQVTNAQLFETRSTRYAKVDILDKLNKSGNKEQIKLRDSIVKQQTPNLQANDTIETFFDDHHMGLVIYRDGKPYDLLGFWNPSGKPVNGGSLSKGNGNIKTPFNPALINKFKNESVVYVSGLKKGPVFYYCDCASVLRRGTFNNNVKEGLWKEFKPNGEFIKEKQIKVITEDVIRVKAPDEKDWLQPAHCMMRNPDELDLKCPEDLNNPKKN